MDYKMCDWVTVNLYNKYKACEGIHLLHEFGKCLALQGFETWE